MAFKEKIIAKDNKIKLNSKKKVLDDQQRQLERCQKENERGNQGVLGVKGPDQKNKNL